MTQGNCPSCGAVVEFTAGSAQVVVCGHCQTVVARKGINLEAHGKIGAILATDSPLRLGLEGRYERVGYRLVGHIQKDHGAGPWDEWYVEFDDGRTGWLSEAEGAFHLLFAEGDQPGLKLDTLVPGQRLRLRGKPLVIEEIGHGRVVAAAGQLPGDVDPSADSYYVDATGPKGLFVTLDFGTRDEAPEVFIGHTLKLEQLGIPLSEMSPRVKKTQLQQARCTQCNGPLELRAPDQSRRVACPYCGALLDCSKGQLAFLQLLKKPEVEPVIPLGAKGRLEDAEWICIGFMVRSCTVEGVRYPWEEYLLYNASRGFRWLMNSNGHWVFLTPLNAGDAEVVPDVSAFYEGRRYKAFQKVKAVTETVLGEFYWEVRAGERTRATEYVDPPYSINVDATKNEVSYTHGEYLEPKVVREAFGLESMPPKSGIAPSQPNPHSDPSIWGWTILWAAVLVGLFIFINVTAAKEVVADVTAKVPRNVLPGSPEAMTFSEPFDIRTAGNVKVEFTSDVTNDWLGIQGDLVDESTGEVVSVYGEMSYYAGMEAGETWTEGSRGTTEYLSSVKPGRYVLRTTPFFDTKTRQLSTYNVRLTSDSPRFLWFGWALVLLFAGPLFAILREAGFESERWAESNLAPDE